MHCDHCLVIQSPCTLKGKVQLASLVHHLLDNRWRLDRCSVVLLSLSCQVLSCHGDGLCKLKLVVPYLVGLVRDDLEVFGTGIM